MAEPSEAAQQMMLIRTLKLLAKNCMWWSTPNEGVRTQSEAGRMLGMGMRPGMPDLCILRRTASGTSPQIVFVELKRTDGRVSAVQRQCHDDLKAMGCDVIIAYGYDMAVRCLEAHGILPRDAVQTAPVTSRSARQRAEALFSGGRA